MSTEMQIKANRKNAQKSTGPRTEEGKEAVSQNAVKHGLCAAKNVIKTESQDEYDFFHDKMFVDLSPQGAMEEMLAERIVSLSWRLKRAEHFQNAVIDALIEHGLHGASYGFGWSSEDRKRAQIEAEAGDMDIMLGIVINHDFANSKTLDMLLSYERRIESSLYRATSELRKLRRSRQEETAWAEAHPINTNDQILTTNDKNAVEQSHPHHENSVRDEDATQTDFQPEILNSNLEVPSNIKSQNTKSENITEVFAAATADVEKQSQIASCKWVDEKMSR